MCVGGSKRERHWLCLKGRDPSLYFLSILQSEASAPLCTHSKFHDCESHMRSELNGFLKRGVIIISKFIHNIAQKDTEDSQILSLFSRPPYTDPLWGQRVEGLESPLDPGEARQGLREQPIISNSNMWQEKDLMGPMSHFSPHRPAMSPPTPPRSLPTVQIVDRTPRLAKRRARKRGQEWGLIFACPSIVRGVKSDSTVSNSFSPWAARARQERPGWQMTPNICVMQPLQMRDSTSQSLSFYLSIEPSHSPPTTHTYSTRERVTGLPWKLPCNGLIIISFKVYIFLPLCAKKQWL